jgi:hypothetical protein
MSGGIAGQNREYALSEVVGFVLLLGVLIAAMTLWMVYVVPVNGREAEITHMNLVKDQFTDYKISLDSLWINSPYGANYDQSGVTLSTSMDLGTGGGDTQASGLFMPLMNPIPSSATLAVNDNGDRMTISSLGPNDLGIVQSSTYPMSALEYQSQNNYWLQQKYYYQSGGVFLSQVNGSTCRVSPPISFKMNGDGITNSVTITPIALYGTGNMGGSGPVRVDTTILNVPPPTIATKYWVNTSVSVANYTTAMMWLDMFNNTRRSGQILNSNYYWFGNSSPSAIPGVAYMNITGYAGSSKNDMTTPDVYLKIQPVNYTVTINNIVSNLN